MILSIIIVVVMFIIRLFNESLFQYAESMVASINFTNVVFNIMLSFLLFAGAMHTDASLLKRERISVAVFSFFSVFLSTIIIGTSLYFFMRLVNRPVPYLYCFLFGSIISPTDPITVLSILTKANVPKRVEINIVGESLFNDGVAVVIFLVLLEMINSGIGHVSFLDISILFLREAVGGILFGYLLGYILHRLLKTIDHYQTEVMLTLAFVMAGYSFANYIHVSGPLSMVIAGLITGNLAKEEAMSHTSRQYMEKFWEMIDVLMNAVLFVLIGLRLIVLKFDMNYLYASLVLLPMVLLARYISIKIPVMLGNRYLNINRKTQLLMFWGGLRGGLSIAMVLSLEAINVKDFFVFATYIIVLFSILVQGLTVGPLAQRLYKQRSEVQKKIES